ncbi:MAG: hypothetical protein JNL36_03325 [Candidatus Kapabacteria bacterium]|nr:hypothetical protein [Candidatus Kapabacteria bacterium]
MVEYEDLPTSEENRNYRNRIRLVSGIVSFIVFLLISFFIAPLGFSPTDDGYILSMSNNIFHGQIPHKDFITIRPVASSILALYSYFPIFDSIQLFVTRIICALEFVLIAWMWIQIVFQRRNIEHPKIFIVAITVITTAITIHDFPLMAWHTIDGIFFCSLALLIRTKYQNKPTNSSLFFSYLFLGIAVLCKQSFAPVVLASLILFQDYKRIFPFVGFLLFPLLYVAWINSNGGLIDLLIQLSAQSKILGVGFKRYVVDLWFLGGITVGIGVWILQNSRFEDYKKSINLFLIISMVVFLLFDFTFGNNLSKSSVVLFGILIPICLKAIIEKREFAMVTTMIIGIAWSSALSIGYSFPSLLCGGMLLVLFLELEIEIQNNWKTTSLSFAIALVFVCSFVFARTTKIYREQSVQYLHYPLGEVLKNGKGIYTNGNTYFFLYDVQTLRQKYNQKLLIFAPDMAGLYSSKFYQQPTISPWARDLELPSQLLKEHFAHNLQQLGNSESMFAVSKFRVDSLAFKLTTFNTETSDSPVVRFAKKELRLVDSTRFFYIYTK